MAPRRGCLRTTPNRRRDPLRRRTRRCAARTPWHNVSAKSNAPASRSPKHVSISRRALNSSAQLESMTDCSSSRCVVMLSSDEGGPSLVVVLAGGVVLSQELHAFLAFWSRISCATSCQCSTILVSRARQRQTAR
jgi:hypothetical protein